MREMSISGQIVKVNDWVYPYVSVFKWRILNGKSHKYPIVTLPAFFGRRTVSMHEMIFYWVMGKAKKNGFEIDHKDGDPFNNTTENLRIATKQQNQFNSSGKRGSSIYKGVFSQGSKWVAQIRQDGKTIRIGAFESEACAALAYDVRAVELRGEFARRNFPEALK